MSSLAAVERSIRDTSAQDVAVSSSRIGTRRRRLLFSAGTVGLVLLIGCVLLVRSWASTTVVVPIARVRIAEVSQGQFVRDVAAQGTIVAAERPTLFAPAAGTVTFNIRAGDTVSEGQVLAVVDSPALKNEYQRERTTFEGMNVALKRQSIEVRRQMLANRQASDLAGVEIKAAERELKRAQSALEIKVIPERDYARAVDDVDTARLAHEHALSHAKLQDEALRFELETQTLQRNGQQLLVEDLARRVEQLTVRSPVNGVVGNLAVDQKAAVGENAALLTVVDLSAFEIEFQVPESYANDLGIDMAAEIAYGGKTFKGVVTAISPEVQQNEVRGRVRFAEEPPAGLRQNQRVNLRIVMDSRPNVVKVERGAFVDGGSVAYVVNGDTATRRPITIGAMSVGEVEIVSGLAAGDKVIVSGIDDFKDAATIRLAD